MDFSTESHQQNKKYESRSSSVQKHCKLALSKNTKTPFEVQQAFDLV
jgi:hypothetical protein